MTLADRLKWYMDCEEVNSTMNKSIKSLQTKPDRITNVIFSNPATVVFWSDGTKTVVKCKNETYDPEKGLAMAIAKRFLGNKGNYYNIFKKWLPKNEKEKNFDFAAWWYEDLDT